MNTKMLDENLTKKFVEERDAAVKSLDTKVLRKFYQKWQNMGVYEIPIPADEKVVEIAMYKMLYHTASATAEEKQRAEEWLTAHGCTVDF